MKDIINNTTEEITEYNFYTTNDFGTIKNPNVTLSENGEDTRIKDPETNNGVYLLRFPFENPIHPKERKDEMTINIKINKGFNFSDEEIIFMCPWNYGKKIRKMSIKIITLIPDLKLVCELHETGKFEKIYDDKPIGRLKSSTYSDKIVYADDVPHEIDMEKIYYVRLYRNK